VSLCFGLALLYFGAEWLVGSASRLAASFGVRPLVAGLTVVAYGTSSPELVVGIGAAARDQGGIALGNVIGSNVANIGPILALAALIRPPAIDRTLRRREVPVLLGTTALVPLILIDGAVERWEGAGLLILGALYTFWMVRSARGDPSVVKEAGYVAFLFTLVASGSRRSGRIGRSAAPVPEEE
jgi:cation:H+ antiporter